MKLALAFSKLKIVLLSTSHNQENDLDCSLKPWSKVYSNTKDRNSWISIHLLESSLKEASRIIAKLAWIGDCRKKTSFLSLNRNFIQFLRWVQRFSRKLMIPVTIITNSFTFKNVTIKHFPATFFNNSYYWLGHLSQIC